jgi:hypothetical protein
MSNRRFGLITLAIVSLWLLLRGLWRLANPQVVSQLVLDDKRPPRIVQLSKVLNGAGGLDLSLKIAGA